MARKYAGIMALIGMTTVMLRAIHAGGQLSSAVPAALLWFVALGVVGWVVGMIAESTISESVRTRLEKELAALNLAREAASSPEASPETRPSV